MLVRSVRVTRAYNFQDMWKRKSTRPTTSRKAGQDPDDFKMFSDKFRKKISKLSSRNFTGFELSQNFGKQGGGEGGERGFKSPTGLNRVLLIYFGFMWVEI